MYLRAHQRGCSSWKLVRVGLKTIVVMAGGCALQANPRIFQPQTGDCTTNFLTSCCVASARPSEHEACFKHAARLICALTRCPETGTWRHAGGVNNRQVSAKEERVFAIGGRHCEPES